MRDPFRIFFLLIPDKAQTIRIFNSRGQLMAVQEGKKGMNDIQVAQYTPGVYYIQTQNKIQKAIKY